MIHLARIDFISILEILKNKGYMKTDVPDLMIEDLRKLCEAELTETKSDKASDIRAGEESQVLEDLLSNYDFADTVSRFFDDQIVKNYCGRVIKLEDLILSYKRKEVIAVINKILIKGLYDHE